MRENNRLASQKFRKVLLQHYGGAKKCVCCGEPISEPIWHHILPVANGGQDIVTNIVPVCEFCHKAIHNMKPAFYYKCKANNSGGRPKKKWVDNAEDIFDDYLHCRISKIEAKERLKVKYNFCDRPEYKEWLFKQNVKSARNNLDYTMCLYNCIAIGQNVGYIEYEDGTRIEIPWPIEQEPKSGKSIVPTGKWSKRVKKRAVSLDLYKNTVIDDSEEPQKDEPVKEEATMPKANKAGKLKGAKFFTQPTPKKEPVCNLSDDEKWWRDYKSKYLVV